MNRSTLLRGSASHRLPLAPAPTSKVVEWQRSREKEFDVVLTLTYPPATLLVCQRTL
jgi:hypothetical protein